MDLFLPRAAGLRLSLLPGMKAMGQVHSLTHHMAAQLQARGLMAQSCWLALRQRHMQCHHDLPLCSVIDLSPAGLPAPSSGPAAGQQVPAVLPGGSLPFPPLVCVLLPPAVLFSGQCLAWQHLPAGAAPVQIKMQALFHKAEERTNLCTICGMSLQLASKVLKCRWWLSLDVHVILAHVQALLSYMMQPSLDLRFLLTLDCCCF